MDSVGCWEAGRVSYRPLNDWYGHSGMTQVISHDLPIGLNSRVGSKPLEGFPKEAKSLCISI